MSFDINSLLPVEALLSPYRHSTHPWLTWYSVSGERVELSGRVFDNWVAKSANLLSEEFDLSAGDVVGIDMPGHWKSAALALACWHLGAELRCFTPGENPGDVDLFITSSPQTLDVGTSVEVLVVPLPSLAMSFDGQLPVGATDFASEVRSYADSYFPSPIDTSGTALSHESTNMRFTDLFVQGRVPAGTTLVTTNWPLERLLPAIIELWSTGTSVVLIEDGVEITKGLLDGERISVQLEQDQN